MGVGVGAVISPNFRWRRATSSSISSSSFGCNCRISMFMMLSSSSSSVVDVVGMVDGFGFGISWMGSSKFVLPSIFSLLFLSMQVVVAILCEIFSVALSISLL